MGNSLWSPVLGLLGIVGTSALHWFFEHLFYHREEELLVKAEHITPLGLLLTTTQTGEEVSADRNEQGTQSRLRTSLLAEDKDVMAAVSEHEGKLVHFTGRVVAASSSSSSSTQMASTQSDPDFDLERLMATRSLGPPLSIQREVEQYQWHENRSQEKKEKLGGSQEVKTTYHYRQGWSSHPIDSQRFHQQAGHHNPPTFVVGGKGKITSYVTDEVKVGPFYGRSQDILSQLKSVALARQRWAPETLSCSRVGSSWVRRNDGRYYLCRDGEKNPPVLAQVGDHRVEFNLLFLR